MSDSDSESSLLTGAVDLRDHCQQQPSANQRYGTTNTSQHANSSSSNLTTHRSSSHSEQYRPEATRKWALRLIQLCHLFSWTAAFAGIYFLPRMVFLPEEYQYLVNTIQVLFYCSGWIAGVLTDCVMSKKKALLLSVLFSSGGYLACMAIHLLAKDNSHYPNSTITDTTDVNDPVTNPLVDHLKNGYNYPYFGILIAASLMITFLNILLPTLGADQINPHDDPEGVRVFYAWFYFFAKVGEMLNYICFILIDHQFLHNLASWTILISSSCVLALILVVIIVCYPKLTREPNADMSVVTDGLGILKEAYERRRLRPRETSFLYGAAICKGDGGSFPDAAVKDRIDIAKFAILCMALIPIALSVAPSPYVDYNPSNEGCGNETAEEEKYNTYDINISIHIAQTGMAGIGIILVYYFCHVTTRFSKPTMLRRLVVGHFIMIFSSMTALFGYYQEVCSNYYKILPYTLTGLTNAVVYTTGYELTFISAPRSMQGTAMGMYFLVIGIGYSLNLALAEYLHDTADVAKVWVWCTGVGGNLLGLVLLVSAHRRFDLHLGER